MSSPAARSQSLHLIERLPNGTVRFIALADGAAVAAVAGAQYAVIDKSTGKSPEGLRVVRKGDALVVQHEDDGQLAQIDNFFQHNDVIFVPQASLEGETLSGATINAGTAPVDTTAAGEPVLWQGGDDDGGAGATWTGTDWALVGVGVVGLGAAIAAGNDDDNDDDDATPPVSPEPVNNTVAGTITGGPVVAGNDLRIEIYSADGTTKLGEGTVNADGTFSVPVGDYFGVVIARVVNTGAGADYADEATEADKDLTAQLFALETVTEPNSTVNVNLNVLTTIAYHKAVEAAGGGVPTPEQVAAANTAIAAAFGLDSLHGTPVEPINGDNYNGADGLNTGERYGAVLAALSGADAENGGNTQQTIDALVAGIVIAGGVATLDTNAQTIVVQGAARTTEQTGVDLTPGVVVVVDTTAPVFTSGGNATAINEGSGAGQAIYTATATDAGALSYSLKTDGDAALLSIDSATGIVTLIGNPDFEVKSSYSFTVIATDAAGNTSEQVVTLAINNVDEVAPAITSSGVATPINENSGAGQAVYTVTSTDDIATGTTYSLKAGDDAALFSIDSATGIVTLIGNPDFETKSSYAFTVVATDAANRSSEQAVTLAVNDVDEVVPTITSGATAPAINENSGAGQVVYTVTATDTGAITYSLKTGSDAALFTINSSTGAVTLTGNPDFEAKSSYSFTVVATDAANNSSEQAVTLAINDVDEVPPTITSSATATAIDENSGTGQAVYTVTATDTGAITYTLKTGGDAAQFSINNSTGVVTLTGNPNFEAKSSYSFTVVATDVDNNSSEQAVTLAINDLDEIAPTITSSATATAINENSGAGQVVYTVTATDAGAITYSLKTGGDAALFSINSSTGAVTLTGNPNYETKSSYSFTVVATDAASNASELAVSLAINNLDEVAPTITSNATATAIDENSGASQVVYTVTSTDGGDVATGSTTYSLKAGGDAALFSIDSATGAVTLTGNPDYETKSSYAFTVVATDAASNSSEQAVTLGINDLDEVAPTLSSSTPADDATSVAVGDNIVLTFSENVLVGTGDIVISNGSGDTRTISIGDATQVTIAGNVVTINPTADLNSGETYNVQMASGVLTDAAGNAYAGIADNTTLDFTTGGALETSFVVFDLIEGVSSSHSSRTFDASTTYTIFIRVDSDDYVLNTDGDGPGPSDNWGAWSGGNNLGADDRIILVGSGSPIFGGFGSSVNSVNLAGGGRIRWTSGSGTAADLFPSGQFLRYYSGSTYVINLWAGAGWASAPTGGGGLNVTNNYHQNMLMGVLTSQGLA